MYNDRNARNQHRSHDGSSRGAGKTQGNTRSRNSGRNGGGNSFSGGKGGNSYRGGSNKQGGFSDKLKGSQDRGGKRFSDKGNAKDSRGYSSKDNRGSFKKSSSRGNGRSDYDKQSPNKGQRRYGDNAKDSSNSKGERGFSSKGKDRRAFRDGRSTYRSRDARDSRNVRDDRDSHSFQMPSSSYTGKGKRAAEPKGNSEESIKASSGEGFKLSRDNDRGNPDIFEERKGSGGKGDTRKVVSAASPARLEALEALRHLRERDAFAQDVLASTVDKSKIPREERAFARRLVLGVVSMKGTLDEVIDRCLDSPDDISPAVRDALRLSTYEIIYLEKSPHAAVDQGVELVRSVAPPATGLANKVLRRIVVAKASFPFGDPRRDLDAYSRLHGFPRWLVELLIGQLGPHGAHDFMVASNEPAPVFVAVNALKANEKEVFNILTAAHGEPEQVEVNGMKVPGCYRVTSGVVLLDGRVRRLFNKGMLLVSDATSQAVASLVVGKENPESFLEIGAGRATKTVLCQSDAMRLFGGQIGEYIAVDNREFKAKVLRERAKQYGAHVDEALTIDALDLDDVLGERQFDRVFIDAPCSGLGTLRRHPEIRWRIEPGVIEQHAVLDVQMLVSASSHVAPQGILAYATCTVTAEENADVIAKFLATEQGSAFKLVSCQQGESAETPFFSVALEPGGPDAHFLALFKHKEEESTQSDPDREINQGDNAENEASIQVNSSNENVQAGEIDYDIEESEEPGV